MEETTSTEEGSGTRCPDNASKSSAFSAETIGKVVYALGFILKVHGAPRVVRTSFYRQAMSYLSGIDEPRYEIRVKYLITYPLNQYLKQATPVAVQPDDKFDPVGPFRRWFAARLREFSCKNTAFFFSWFQGKRGAAPLSADSMNAKFAKHREQMGQPDPATAGDVNRIIAASRPTLIRIRAALRKEYDALTREFQADGSCRDQHVASQSACYETSRERGGAIARLRKIAGVTTSSWTAVGVAQVEHGLASGEISLFDEVNHIGSWELESNPLRLCNAEMERVWTSKIEADAARLSLSPYGAKIAGVLEPLKLRVISKGPASAYYVIWRFQVSLWRVLQRMPCFRLIGERMDATFLDELVRHASPCGEGKLAWFSWDYSAATDGSSALLGHTIISGLVKSFPQWEQDIIIRGLTAHQIQYGPETGLKPILQQNGQLMGSPASFGVLCLINLVVYLHTLERVGDTRPDSEKLLGVLINGDDKLRVARESQWAVESAVGSEVGLKESLGKAYAHPVFANVNSKCYHYNLRDAWVNGGKTTAKALPHFNVGLFLGKGKVQNGGSDDRGIVSTMNELLRGVPTRKRQDVLKDFLHRHRQQIAAECEWRNLFIHESLGGMGVDPPPRFRYSVTRNQLRHAHACIREPGNWEWGGGPASGPTLESPSALVRGPWLIPETKATYHYQRLVGAVKSDLILQPGWLQRGRVRVEHWSDDFTSQRRQFEADIKNCTGKTDLFDKLYTLTSPWVEGVEYLMRMFGRVGLA